MICIGCIIVIVLKFFKIIIVNESYGHQDEASANNSTDGGSEDECPNNSSLMGK